MHDAKYAIAIDPAGKLTWRASDIDGEHVITILTKALSDDTLEFLQSKGVSYLFVDAVRCRGSPRAVRKLRLMSMEKRAGDIVWLRYKVWSAATASRSFRIFERPARKD